MGQERAKEFHTSSNFLADKTDKRTNRLLPLLSDDDYERIRPHLVKVDLKYKQSLVWP